jgi:hypothetical protein
MAKKGPYELTERLARARLELERDRERRADELATFLGHLRGLEGDLVAAYEELDRIERVIAGEEAVRASRRRVELNGSDTARVGAVAIATRLAHDGHSPDAVKAFLEENFHDVDAARTVKKLFAEAATARG